MKKSVSKILELLDGKTITEMYLLLQDTLMLDLETTRGIIKEKTGKDIVVFEDLVFKPHPIAPDGIMSAGEIGGKRYSIISGKMFYSSGPGSYEIYNDDMEDPDGWNDERDVTLSLLDLMSDY